MPVRRGELLDAARAAPRDGIPDVQKQRVGLRRGVQASLPVEPRARVAVAAGLRAGLAVALRRELLAPGAELA